MLQDGKKGAALQRDQNLCRCPALPGVVTPEMLRKIADVAEKYHAKAVKYICPADRVVGLEEKDIDKMCGRNS